MSTKVVITKADIPKNPVVIEAFPSKGFVSTIVANHMIKELDMEQIGYIESDRTPSITIIHNSKPQRPVRIYSKKNLLLIFSELIAPLEIIPEFSKSLVKWFEEVKPKQLILLAGISGIETEKEHEILGVATDEESKKKLKKLNVSEIEEGMLTGISSELFMYCFERGIPSISLMTETHYIPDPFAAASMLKILNGLLGIDVETENLTETGKQIEKSFREIAEQLKRGKEGYKKMEGLSPMYG